MPANTGGIWRGKLYPQDVPDEKRWMMIH